MQDHKMAAANDQESETLPRKEQSNAQTVTREYLLGVLTFLESMTGRELAEGDVAFWIERLMKYPKAKLHMLQDYTGRLDNGVFAYLDTVRVPEKHVEPLRALPEPKSELAKDMREHSAKINAAMDYTPRRSRDADPEGYEKERREVIKRKRVIERESLLALHAKYPRAGFDKAIIFINGN